MSEQNVNNFCTSFSCRVMAYHKIIKTKIYEFAMQNAGAVAIIVYLIAELS